MDSIYLQQVLAGLANMFPGHSVTLVLRCDTDSAHDAVVTDDGDPARASVLLNEFVLRHFTHGALH